MCSTVSAEKANREMQANCKKQIKSEKQENQGLAKKMPENGEKKSGICEECWKTAEYQNLPENSEKLVILLKLSGPGQIFKWRKL